ncbi:2,5-dichloro-2,5-cyclohexadiene-1,4-diol dehydrogenase [Lachnellula subtilissima]|uniref:2,5-dichloro-2,5-cyclohexadiene-1,4-diol dehydrogenase n=1 Tax=Lachnellula subtilissima TaxID=602034 RepID=A0A8H8UFN9_9HELO|nr:2,5-dichloro-2,5-cyclohexadiene-1,4-diol dehydrogenase [Lachnellula subtilissima]
MDITASGIGRSCAIAFAKYGARSLTLADLNLEAAQAVARECQSHFTNPDFSAESVVVDVTQQHSVQAAMDHAVRTFGRIDYCVNSAGVGVKTASETAEADIEEFKNMLEVNATGTFIVTRTMSAIMKSQESCPVDEFSPGRGSTRGSIVNLGSASSFVATPKMIQYTASKHAVIGITKNAALDNAAYGIRVNSVCPSWVDTPMIRKAMDDIPGLGKVIEAAVPLGRIAMAEEVADAVMFFCSPRSSYATGCNFILDGGTTLSSNI